MIPSTLRDAEWLEADGLGGFSSGTVGGPRTRRYHAVLCVAAHPPTGRTTLVDGFEAWLQHGDHWIPLSSQRYAPDVIAPDAQPLLTGFTHEPWPTWRYSVGDGVEVIHELFVPRGYGAVVLRWRLSQPLPGARLVVRPFLSGRDVHALHHENGSFRFEGELEEENLAWRPYAGLPGIRSRAAARYQAEPHWYRAFVLREEANRGFDAQLDLAAPGLLHWELGTTPVAWLLEADGVTSPALPAGAADRVAESLAQAERRRRTGFASPLHRAADAYLVKRGSGSTVIAGYPWFTDWGRDTFISLRGLCLATGRLDEAREILLAWADSVSEGMLPNRFVDEGDAAEFNAVDASLWYAIAAWEWRQAMRRANRKVTTGDARALQHATRQILTGYAQGTRYRIGADSDGLLRAGVPGVQLTWMDAKVGDWVVTPRIGKPVEVQALWLNALRVGGRDWDRLRLAGMASFGERFWNTEREMLYDVVDVDHQPGTADPSFRPNQILAIGGLPWPIVEGAKARQVVGVCEASLHTPLGLRSLAPGEPGYAPHYRGGPLERDAAYHQGTVWPWLIGPFVEAWVRVRGNTAAALREARQRFLTPLLAHLDEAGLGHISEIADAEAPHTPNGCPFQAWSVGEALRLDQQVLASRPRRARATK